MGERRTKLITHFLRRLMKSTKQAALFFTSLLHSIPSNQKFYFQFDFIEFAKLREFDGIKLYYNSKYSESPARHKK